MNAGGTGFLRQSGNQFFNLLADHHHQVGEFVDHHDDVGQAFQRLGLVGRQAEGVVEKLALVPGFFYLGVVAREIAHPQLAHELVALFHLAHAPVQAVRSLPHVGHHGRQQVRNAFVDAHLKHLGVNEQQAHITRIGLVQQAQNHRVDADGFA